jgi:hydrogenase nickel incorporation protein HypA/HybF
VHEASIALSIAQEVCERACVERAAAVTEVRLRIGALTSVVPDALRFAWDLATESTLAAGSRLEIEDVPLAIYCATCGVEREIAHGAIPVCPVCATPSANIVHGRELLITAIEVTDDPQTDRRPAKHPSQEQHARA